MAEHNMKDTLETTSEYMGTQLRGQLDLKEEKFRVDELPTPSASIEGEIYQYMGDSTVDYQHSYFYECVALGTSPETYGWLGVNVQPSESGQTIQYDTMPEASNDNEGDIVQYIGTTDANYTNGYFYKCVAKGTEPETYEWQAISVQTGGGGQTIQYDTMPIASSTNVGKIVQYIGTTDSTYTRGFFYECNESIEPEIQLIGDIANFQGSGDSHNYVISTSAISLKAVYPYSSKVACVVPLEDKSTLKISVLQESGTTGGRIKYTLGTTQGASDLYVSSDWGNIGVNNSRTFEIDLTQYNEDEIYLSFTVDVYSGDNIFYAVNSIVYGGGEKYNWVQTNVQPNSGESGQEIQIDELPEASSALVGEIREYIGTDSSNYTNGWFYKCIEGSGSSQVQLIGTTSNFEGNGNSANYSINASGIELKTGAPATSYVYCTVPLSNDSPLTITVLQEQGNTGGKMQYLLGSSKGASDLYVSSDWGNIGVNQRRTFTIDLTQYPSPTIYLSFKVIVESGNNIYYLIESILYGESSPPYLWNVLNFGHKFSKNEQRVAQWFTGSWIYEKTVTTGGSVPSGATELYRFEFTGYDILWYIKSL